MSVTNMLMYQAALVMPRTASFAQRTKRVQQLITLLFLANVADRRCASLSKGELRRVSLGMALLSRPKVLLMDEPFTDNDAYVQDSLLLVCWRVFVCVLCVKKSLYQQNLLIPLTPVYSSMYKQQQQEQCVAHSVPHPVWSSGAS